MRSSNGSFLLVLASLIALILEPSDPARFIAVQLFVCTTLICRAIEKRQVIDVGDAP